MRKLPIPMLAVTAALLAAACQGLGGGPEADSIRSADSSPPVSSAPAAVEPATIVGEDPVADAEIRRAVERTLPYLEEHGVAWIDKHQCTSCHQIPVMIWTHHSAAERGLEVDGAKLDEWTKWVLAEAQGKGSSNSDGMAQLILGRPAAMDGAYVEGFDALTELVAGRQKADGSWKAGGQLPDQRRPESETHRVSTAWAVLALASLDEPGEAVDRGRARIDGWIEAGAEGESHEWLVVRLLYADRFGDEGLERELFDQLAAEQNSDGGWSWLRGEASDAFATGQSLYALGLLGRVPGDPVVRRARQFLLDTQEEDGTWFVRSTLSEGKGVTPTSRYWGTGWAAIGLLSTLSEAVPRG
ncbi:MAG: prenyltransferase/squalene oxidase repeat-containing protein [Thermoanaerobaculia bacterium]